jgi:DNA-binding LacI/PurR family transcriptional regulator
MAKSKRPLYEVIYRHYKKKILEGALEAGSKLPSETELSQEFDVSRITAVRALKELELRNLIYRVKGSGSFVNDKDAIARQKENMPASNLSIISLVMPFEETHSSEIIMGIEDVAKEQGYFVTTHNTSDDPEKEKSAIEEIIERGSHGIIVYPISTCKNLNLYSSLLIENYPFVVIDKKFHGIDTNLVWTDNKQAFYELTNHLFDQGHKRIAFVGINVFNVSSELERYNGFCKAHLDRGIPLMDKHLFSGDDINNIPQDYMPDETLVVRECNYLFDQLEAFPKEKRPTAIAVVNDSSAASIMSAAKERGLRIPEDYAVTGFDNLPYAEHLPVPLTTVAQPSYQIGREAAKQLFETIKTPDRAVSSITIPSSLIIRKSSRS